jgi:hypothetical protein
MDEDAKVHWAETVDKPRYRQFTPGNPGLFGGKTKICMNLHSTYTLLLADRQVWIIGKTWEIWAWRTRILIEGHGQSYG